MRRGMLRLRNAVAQAALAGTVMALAACAGDKAPAPASTATPALAGAVASPTAVRANTVGGGTAADRIASALASPTPTPRPIVAQIGSPQPPAGGHAVYLVPFEDVPPELVDRLRAYIEDSYGIPAGVLPAVPLQESDLDPERGQLVAERLIEAIRVAAPLERRGDVLIGLTQYDMMIADTPSWRFAFALRDASVRIGVVSTARMDPANLGEPPDDDLLFTRALKIVAKHIGVLYLGLPMSSDPTSVMFNNVLGLGDLDRMGEALPGP